MTTVSESHPKEQLDSTSSFNIRHCWYPITFLQDLPTNRPYGFSVYDEPLVLFRNQEGQIVCLRDRCPHRAAKLSDGQVIDGKLECLYHGWQFGSQGQCLHIPQLPEAVKIPDNACIKSYPVIERQGIVWVWLGETEAANEEDLPLITGLDKPGCITVDTLRDFPYDQTYLIENLIDPAHVNISHDRSEFGAKREYAQPIEMQILECSAKGIRGQFRNTRIPNERWKQLNFVAPNLVHYHFTFEDLNLFFGLALYALPIGYNRSRILIRRYGNVIVQKVAQKPRWLEHLRQNKILEEDLPLIVGQQQQVEQSGQCLKDVYLPIKTSDLLVIEYRKWLDIFGESIPYYQGYSTVQKLNYNRELNSPVSSNRLKEHTQICSSCQHAHHTTKQVQQLSVGIAIALAALAIILDGVWLQGVTLSASLLAVGIAGVAQKLKTKFESSYTR